MPTPALRSHRDRMEFSDETTFAFVIGCRGDFGAFAGCHTCLSDLGRQYVARCDLLQDQGHITSQHAYLARFGDDVRLRRVTVVFGSVGGVTPSF